MLRITCLCGDNDLRCDNNPLHHSGSKWRRKRKRKRTSVVRKDSPYNSPTTKPSDLTFTLTDTNSPYTQQNYKNLMKNALELFHISLEYLNCFLPKTRDFVIITFCEFSLRYKIFEEALQNSSRISTWTFASIKFYIFYRNYVGHICEILQFYTNVLRKNSIGIIEIP